MIEPKIIEVLVVDDSPTDDYLSRSIDIKAIEKTLARFARS